MASRTGQELTPESACCFGARHMPPAIWVTALGEKRAGINWQDWGPRKDGEAKRHHPVCRPGRERPCRICHRPSMLADCRGQPCHKVCAEAEMLGKAAEGQARRAGVS